MEKSYLNFIRSVDFNLVGKGKEVADSIPFTSQRGAG
jgi:hypothetical protein